MGCTTTETRELALEARRSREDEVWLWRAGRFSPLATSEISVRESTRLGGLRPAKTQEIMHTQIGGFANITRLI